MQSKESLYEKLSEYEDCLVLSEVMKILRVSKNTCYKMLEDGYIRFMEIIELLKRRLLSILLNMDMLIQISQKRIEERQLISAQEYLELLMK